MIAAHRVAVALLVSAINAAAVVAQEAPHARAGSLAGDLHVDGALDEAAWGSAEVIDRFTQADPNEGQPASSPTMVRVIASATRLAIGIVCDDTDPDGIVSFSVRRDAGLNNEDHVRIVLGPFMDGRSGYVFAVNPSGARYDGLIAPGGENDNADWDGIWDAATRRTNLTRFPLFFPEKRTFFLEGSDIFDFGLGLNQDVIPFFSRRVGLVSGQEISIVGGAKVNGRVGDTNVGGVIVGTNDKRGAVEDESLMAVARVKQNILSESWVGAIASGGDPLGRSGSWLGGFDFTYATSRFRGNKNLLVGVWGLGTGRSDLEGDTTAYGFKIDYPNDEWDIALTHKRIGRDFDPSLGFVPRHAVHLINGQINNRTRIRSGPFQNLFHEFQPFIATDLSGKWESYRVFMAPVNWRFRSGDRVELNVNPTGERLVAPFEAADGVVIPAGEFDRQQRCRMPRAGERNVGDLESGNFRQTLIGNRLRINMSPDLSVASYIQYDTDSDSIGVNTRLRWTFTPAADLFVVYNHNVRSVLDRWQLDSNQLLIKLQCAWRM